MFAAASSSGGKRRPAGARRSRFRNLGVETLEPRQMLHAAAEWSTFAEGESAPVPDFQLADTNTTSPRFGQNVSPRDYLNQVSAWYFGNAL